jgi:hypothetical protein
VATSELITNLNVAVEFCFIYAIQKSVPEAVCAFDWEEYSTNKRLIQRKRENILFIFWV